MNDLYTTPCSPMKCDLYVYGELCGQENTCQLYMDYQTIKLIMKKQKDASWERRDYVANKNHGVRSCRR